MTEIYGLIFFLENKDTNFTAMCILTMSNAQP